MRRWRLGSTVLVLWAVGQLFLLCLAAMKTGDSSSPEIVQDEEGALFMKLTNTDGVPRQLMVLDEMEVLDGDWLDEATETISDMLEEHGIEADADALIEEAKRYIHPSNLKSRQRMALTKLFHSLKGPPALVSQGGWLSETIHYCDWEGVVCGKSDPKAEAPDDAVTRLDLSSLRLSGTIPTEIVFLDSLISLKAEQNLIMGTIPKQLIYMSSIEEINLSYNRLEGTFPAPTDGGPSLRHVTGLKIDHNFLTGVLPEELSSWKHLVYLDVGVNAFTGPIPNINQLGKLQHLGLGENLLSGTIPLDLSSMSSLHVMDVGSNLLTGHIPSGYPTNLTDLILGDNILTGELPYVLLDLPKLEVLVISDNAIGGPLPSRRDLDDRRWSGLSSLGALVLSGNRLTGTLPVEMFEDLNSTLRQLDVASNRFSGPIATELGLLTALHTIDAMSNQLTGTLPNEMLGMNPNLRLNFSDNLITGTIPSMFCGLGASSMNLLYRDFGCDAVLCRPGTFNIHGHATLHSGCRPCPNTPSEEAGVLGRTTCGDLEYVHGDLDGDGRVSTREVLRMLYVDTIGRFWGPTFQVWSYFDTDECELWGVTCDTRGEVIKIDLSSATLCSSSDRKPGPRAFCKGIPAEIGVVSSLEVFQLGRQQFLRGTIPTEIGRLTNLNALDFSSCLGISGTIPTEIGNLTLLKYLFVSHSRVYGSIPREIGKLKSLEKLHLTNNQMTGPIPTEVGNLVGLKEFMLSRNNLNGPIPSEMGLLLRLENMEIYFNALTGTIPAEVAECKSLKRIDIFHNKLIGTLPESLARIDVLQIVHIKDNKLTGTIPPAYGDMESLTWLDISHNRLHGTIPYLFGTNQIIKDFRIGNNMIYDPIPSGLCSNPNINGGLTKQYGCDGVVCALGSFSDTGHAAEGEGCKKCPDQQTTLYLGSTACAKLSEADILAIFYEVMDGPAWPDDMQSNWGDHGVNVCTWAGISCDDNGEIVGLAFPLVGVEDPKLL